MTNATAATYAPLLNESEETVKVYLDPAEAIKLVTRIRKVTFFIRVEMDLLTEFSDNGQPTRCYDLSENLKVSAAQVQHVLEAKVRFNANKAERDQPTGKIEVARLGNCLFFG
ncbi:hypothetical protein [Roseobacter phage RDJL6]|nr:hypothetical protein [Roseobacter phage RDJL6]